MQAILILQFSSPVRTCLISSMNIISSYLIFIFTPFPYLICSGQNREPRFITIATSSSLLSPYPFPIRNFISPDKVSFVFTIPITFPELSVNHQLSTTLLAIVTSYCICRETVILFLTFRFIQQLLILIYIANYFKIVFSDVLQCRRSKFFTFQHKFCAF